MITKATSFLEGHKEDTKVNERWWLAVKIVRQFISSFPNLEENLSGKKTLTILLQTFSGPKFILLVDTNFYPLENIWIFAFPTFLKGLELYNMYWWKNLLIGACLTQCIIKSVSFPFFSSSPLLDLTHSSLLFYSGNKNRWGFSKVNERWRVGYLSASPSYFHLMVG